MALTRTDQSRALWWIVAGVVGVALLALGALLFVSSFTTERALDEAEALRTADLTLAAHDVAMKSIGQLVLLAEDASLQVASGADVAAAADEAERTMAEVGARFERLDPGVQEELASVYGSWQQSAAVVIAQASAGGVQQASAGLAGELAPASERFVEELAAERDARALSVAEAGDGASSVGRVFGFLTLFLIPLIAIIAYWFTARRQLQVAANHLDARIEAEKSLGRAKDQFIAGISAELRAPLTSISGFSEALLDGGITDPHAADLVELISQETAEVTRVVDDLSVAAHGESVPLPLDLVVLDIDEQIQEVVATFRRHGHQIAGTWGEGRVEADRTRVRQILRNLVANAIQHGGPDIRIYGDAAGSKYVVSVEDNGPGLPKEIVDKLFTRADAGGEPLVAGSVGLGLAVAKSLAKAMGGSLDYDRVANRTAFVLSLPLAAGRIAAERTVAVEQ